MKNMTIKQCKIILFVAIKTINNTIVLVRGIIKIKKKMCNEKKYFLLQ